MIGLICGVNEEDFWPVLSEFDTLVVIEEEPINPVSTPIDIEGGCLLV